MNTAACQIRALPVLVLFPHNRCNCRCVMCDIWRIRQRREISARDLDPHLAAFEALGVRWVVFSGGEPQLHSDLASLARLFRSRSIRVTLLTAGLLLKAHSKSIAETIDDVIVSLDGPPPVHNQVRGVPRAFELLADGIRALRDARPHMHVSGRSTVLKANFRYLRDTVRTSREIGLNSISFLAADIATEAFNRTGGWPAERKEAVSLDAAEIDMLDAEIEALIREHSAEIDSGYIAESPEKLRRISLHYRAHLGQAPPVAPRCNAPWVSAVVEADGTVRPCFFHPPIGNIYQQDLLTILNGEQAVRFREKLDIPSNPVCRTCVCSLYLSAENIASM